MRFNDLLRYDIDHGHHISTVLDQLARIQPEPWEVDLRTGIRRGTAFLTFAYDIDGVSMEILKYGRCLQRIVPGASIHCIGGSFGDKADVVLDLDWHRFELPGADGWDKWDDGKWFSLMFYDDLPPGSAKSSELANEMWRQAIALAQQLVAYIEKHQIGMLFTVNTNSNPGNVALAMGIVFAAETTGCVVINNNHDFYWEGGKAGCKRNPGELPGPRDHFFRNHDNEEFFGVFQRMYPWNASRWVQVNINSLQSRRLIDRLHFAPGQIFTIGTGLDPTFFREPTPTTRQVARFKMSHVLGGDRIVQTTRIDRFRESVAGWMIDQHPVVLGRRPCAFDITSHDALYLLQPTRIVARKRIWRDWDLIDSLMSHRAFRSVFERRPEMTLTLHITGPVPIEHQLCLERVLDAFQSVLDRLPTAIGDRIFLALSAGAQRHPSMDDEIDIVEIYQLADLVVFPSLTEGRGLPIAEAAAAGIPIVCSHYDPPAVFAEVVGMHLPAEDQILYEDFPDGEIPVRLLDRVTSILLEPEGEAERIAHNREAARRRYSLDVLQESLAQVIEHLEPTVRSQ